ncbi:MAG: T9SS type A sorting domain-containing protein [Candidatus Edwardsbacteria bacterium]
MSDDMVNWEEVLTGNLLIRAIVRTPAEGVEELQSSKFKVQSPNLMQNYPNPFSQNTDIRYQIADDSKVSLKIYNVAGQLVRTLLAYEPKSPGAYKVTWDSRDESGKQVSAGVYFYRLEAGNFTDTKKMILLR